MFVYGLGLIALGQALKNNQRSADGYTTKNFDLCPTSRTIADKMKRDGYSPSYRRQFLQDEDDFLALEILAVCNLDSSAITSAIDLDRQMRARFPNQKLVHHPMHIRQMMNPNQKINKFLNCKNL